MADEEWPTPEDVAEGLSKLGLHRLSDEDAARQHSDLIKRFQIDYREVEGVPPIGEVGIRTALALMMANGKCFARDLRKGYCFSYGGLPKVFEAQSDPVPDDRIEGRVILPVTDHGLRDGMRTRLDAESICTLHLRPSSWPSQPSTCPSSEACPKCGARMRGPAKIPGGSGLLCQTCGHSVRY